MPSQPAFFKDQPIRRIYDEATNSWWFSIVDIVKILTDQSDARTASLYWSKLKQRLKEEGSQLVTDCQQLKLPAEDGKQRLTDCASAETLLRLVQSVPSPKAEPIKLWLAKTGYERMQELADPSLSLDRARETYKKKGIWVCLSWLVIPSVVEGPAFLSSHAPKLAMGRPGRSGLQSGQSTRLAEPFLAAEGPE